MFGTVLAAAMAVVALAGCSSGEGAKAAPASEAPTELHVAAAATLQSALTDMAPEFEKVHGVKLMFDFGASGVLQKQIESGAAIDVFASAAPSQVDSLTAEGLVSADAAASFISNRLVIVTPKGNPAGIHGLGDIAKAKRLAVGNPNSAPHGAKAKEWLTNEGQWDSLASRMVFGENAAQTTAYVTRGEVDAGLVFASEAAGRDDLEVVCTVPADQIKPIRYVIAQVAASKQQTLARDFIDYMTSDAGQSALERHGFVALDPTK